MTFLDLSKRKALVHNKINVNKKFVKRRVEIILGKQESAGLPAFSPFPNMYSKASSGSLKVNWLTS